MWKNDRKVGGGAYFDQCSLRVRNEQKCRAWKAFQTIDTALRKVGGGRLKKSTGMDDRYSALKAKRARYQSESVIAQQLRTSTRRQVSRFIIARRLHTGSTYSPAVLNATSF
ncbi:hypothetical protein TNCV_3215771 [Trichonephila clavipes]|nr:hypothetical protein TNCV_3215771 [Trichonephila clavipes]